MADRNRSNIDVQLLMRDSDAVHAVQHLARERLVQFPNIDVIGLEAMALEQARDRENRADAHFVWLARCNGKSAEDAERL